ncbi:response regulator [Ottowia sp.]|uniref:response regulator transcription factor n=1 Tax=Ottowia sp. TaxID=1898956 RepID=UPI0025E7B930|nr:response regulator [Ottowia sp.]MBK6614060.1 response regulator [Ottowia sp.]
MSNDEIESPHILIIDDDPDQLRLLVAALRNTSYRVSVALDGDQGYARATVLLPDLILLDVRMPGRNGITIARLLKTNPATRHIPILFLSALTDQHERLAGLRAGAVDYIGKPFYVDEILERIRIHLILSQRKTPLAIEGTGIDHPRSDDIPLNLLPANLMLKQVATEFILNHINESSLKSSDVASSLKVSMRRLNSVFEACAAMSVFEFIRQERMRRAALMLGQSTLAVADIAMEVGYANPANFATEFKKFWGKSPRQLRGESQMNFDALQQLISSKFD